MMSTPTTSAPTQVRFSARSVVRTVLQSIIPTALALGLIVPEVIEVVLESAGESMPSGMRGVLLAISAGVAAGAGALAKVMSLPRVEAVLRSSRFTRWLAAEPVPVPPVDVDPEAGQPSLDDEVFGSDSKAAATYHGRHE
jgi:hypothetical protein